MANGNYYSIIGYTGVYRGYVGGFIGTMEKKMETI